MSKEEIEYLNKGKLRDQIENIPDEERTDYQQAQLNEFICDEIIAADGTTRLYGPYEHLKKIISDSYNYVRDGISRRRKARAETF